MEKNSENNRAFTNHFEHKTAVVARTIKGVVTKASIKIIEEEQESNRLTQKGYELVKFCYVT